MDSDSREQYAQGHLDNRVEQVSVCIMNIAHHGLIPATGSPRDSRLEHCWSYLGGYGNWEYFKYEGGLDLGRTYSIDVCSLLHWPTIIKNISECGYIIISVQLVDLQA